MTSVKLTNLGFGSCKAYTFIGNVPGLSFVLMLCTVTSLTLPKFSFCTFVHSGGRDLVGSFLYETSIDVGNNSYYL